MAPQDDQESPEKCIVLKENLAVTLFKENLEPIEKPRKSSYLYEVDGMYGWVQVFSAGLLFFLVFGVTRSFSLLYEQLIEKFRRSDSVTSWVPSVSGTVRLCSSPLVGILLQRLNERIVFFIGAVTASVSLALTALSPSIEFVFLFYGFFYAIGVNCCIISCQTNTNKYFEKKRGLVNGIVFACMPLGSLALTPVIQILFDEYDYMGAMLILSSIVSHIFLSAILMRPMPMAKLMKLDKACDKEGFERHISVELDGETALPQAHVKDNTGSQYLEEKCVNNNEKQVWDENCHVVEHNQSTPSDEEISSENIPGSNYENACKVESGSIRSAENKNKCSEIVKLISDGLGFKMLKIPSFGTYCLFLATSIMCIDVTLTFQTAMMREKGYSEMQAVTSLMVFNLVDIPTRVVGGLLFDHPKVRKHIVFVSIILFFIVALGQLLFPFALDVSFALSIACLCLTASTRGTVFGQYPNVIANLVGPQNFAASLSLCRFLQGIAIVISSPLGGFLKDATGTYATGWIVMATLLLCESVTFFAIKGAFFIVKYLKKQ